MEKIPFNEVSKALAQRGVSAKCPMCGRSELKALREEELQLLSLNHPKDGNIDASDVTMLPCATAMCLHCGFVAQFALPTLLKTV